LNESRKIEATLIVPLGTKVVLRSEVTTAAGEFSKGTVLEIVQTPLDGSHTYRLRSADAREVQLHRGSFSILKQVQLGPVGDARHVLEEQDLHRYVIYICVVGSRAYGLERDESDVDRRGIYLPPADLHWSLYGVPEQLENSATEECYWELGKFIVLALKANPNILECLYTPMVETTTEISRALLAIKEKFLSKLVYQTYNGYVMSQFKKLEQDLRTSGELKWKHAMHLIRLLLQGISILEEHEVRVNIAHHRAALLEIRDGLRSWEEVNKWRIDLHHAFDEAYRATSLPDVPDYAEANRFLVWARRKMVEPHANP